MNDRPLHVSELFGNDPRPLELLSPQKQFQTIEAILREPSLNEALALALYDKKDASRMIIPSASEDYLHSSTTNNRLFCAIADSIVL